MPTRPLKNSTLFFYGLSDLPVMLAFMPMLLYLNKFYASDVGISLMALANVLLLARIFDLITDPLIGYLSDHTRTRWGRRKPWMVASIPFLMVGVYNIFLPPDGAGIWHLTTWILVMWLGWTMLVIPYYAWGAELSSDYDERTRITGWRAAMGSVGSLLSITIPLIAVLWFGVQGIAGIMHLVGIMVVILIPLAVGATVLTVHDEPDAPAPALQVFDGLKVMMKNGSFRWLAFAFLLTSIGLSVLMPLNAFYVVAVLEEPEASIPVLLFFTSAIGLLAIPLWVAVSKRIGKHRAWICGLLSMTAVSPVYLFFGPGDFMAMVPFALLSAVGTGAFVALPNAMKADVIDIDTARTGENRAAMYFSAWSLVTKAASSIGASAGLWTLSFLGFDAAPGAANTPDAIMGLKVTYALLPTTIFVIAAFVVWNYPISRERQQRIRAAIDRRTARREAARV